MRTWAHPIAIRERALAAFHAGMKADDVAKLFRVAVSVLYDWKRIRKERGSFSSTGAPRRQQAAGRRGSQGGGACRPRRDTRRHGARGGRLLRRAYRPCLQPPGEGAGARADGHHSKRKSLIACERESPRVQALRRTFIDQQSELDPARLSFVDKVGSHVAMTREYAWAPCGQTVTQAVPRNNGVVTTMLGALGITGLVPG